MKMKINKKMVIVFSLMMLFAIGLSIWRYCGIKPSKQNTQAVLGTNSAQNKVEIKSDVLNSNKKAEAKTINQSEKDTKSVIKANSQIASTDKSSGEESMTKDSKTAVSTVPKPNQSPAPLPEKLLVEKIKEVGDAQQVVIVTTDSFSSIYATIRVFEKDNGQWNEVFSQMPGVVGVHGFAWNKVEGDGKAPIGIYSFGTCFGKNANPGTAMQYKQVTDNDYWVDDSNSPLYNTWQIGPANGRWSSAEKLLRSDWLYDYAVVINYNTDRIPGKGSAIFMHLWRSSDNGTAGCVATSEDNLIRIMKWLNPSKNPIIIQGPMSEVLKM
jgi:L,D-peptidoglycan transpeptidase YkuD (ErfK/YbiS/YcfS/YnhG family)